MIYPRTITDQLHQTVKAFAAIVLTGPRQSGKTTLLRREFGSTHQYINLENPDVQSRAIADPIGFLDNIHKPVIIDEIQYAPILLPYIKEKIDNDRTPGQWLLTGSQNFTLMKGVTESLAGRAAILTLLPLSLSERQGNGKHSLDIHSLFSQPQPQLFQQKNLVSKYIFTGGYPEPLTDKSIFYDTWASSYIKTYLERDVRDLKNIGNLLQFQAFLKSCAIRTGQILDLSSLARDIGVSFTTAKTWLSILVASYQIILLPQYFQNLGKRLVKRPKLYFTDTGLAAYLMGIRNIETLDSSPQYGALFETMIVIDFFKREYHHLNDSLLYYLHTRDRLEVDLVIEDNQKLYLIEIKSSSTITSTHISSLTRLKREIPDKIAGSFLLSNSKESFIISGVTQHPALPFLIK
ncbi:GTP-binding protein [Candidatus Roizmanbacteria bacterium CG_4_8_14_3_um_filter_34_9]|uniref:GTP-binding protein n=3 Tax=Candidatus Roizmaniibacteriota TaxID=1752723 RepID=A0A2M7AUN7_9BACT|nr:MAG: GTP-binding protein [Candidatus Roizmanbacteria bacterium CG07_land_8_20_14_0_80_34_15]PIU74344.1 MAG: GTP-binding protein [Candidatus Roizmanbacteria bacterium CG06_land_8_20_14_3_00_34_14]PIW73062.1 MAG: GTP-binding protein [Candidatus Roizmanbacteria bacterium CG_4_8_14_3_um_filter_34_9]